MANTASTIFLLSLVWGVERLCLTLFNLAVAVFLQREWRMGGLSVLGTIYMALQVTVSSQLYILFFSFSTLSQLYILFFSFLTWSQMAEWI